MKIPGLNWPGIDDIAGMSSGLYQPPFLSFMGSRKSSLPSFDALPVILLRALSNAAVAIVLILSSGQSG